MTKKIVKALELGKVNGAKILLANKYKSEHKAKWEQDKKSEYDLLFPEFRVPTIEEKASEYTEYLTTVKDDEIAILEADYEYTPIAIDYSEDESYVSYSDWINEVRILEPEIARVDVVFDDIGHIVTPGAEYVPAVTELVRPYIPLTTEEIDLKVDEYLNNSIEYSNIKRESRARELDKLHVTVNTVAYDANGKAIGNMGAVVGLANFKFNQAIANGATASQAYAVVYKGTSVNWKGADNYVHTVMIESICEALEASMLEVASVLGV